MNSGRRCTARSSRTGARCKRWAIAGGNVCPSHGGSAPQVRQSAYRRLLQLVNPALAAVEAAMRSGEHGPAVKAACAVLDRSGFGIRQADQMANGPLLDVTTGQIQQMSEQELTELAAMLQTALRGRSWSPVDLVPVRRDDDEPDELWM